MQWRIECEDFLYQLLYHKIRNISRNSRQRDLLCKNRQAHLPLHPQLKCCFFLRQMFVLTTKQRHISRNAALHGDAIGGGGAKPPIIAIVYGGNCFDAS